MDKKNEFNHSSIDHLSIKKPEKFKISLEKILMVASTIAVITIGYCNHLHEEKANAQNYSVNSSSSTTSNHSEYGK